MSASDKDIRDILIADLEFPKTDLNPSSASSEVEIVDNRIFNIHKNQLGFSSTLSINLQAYVDSFYHNKTQYKQLQKDLIQQVTGFDATAFWSGMLEAAITGGVDDELAAVIRESPASKFLDESFIELVKNGMDELLLGRSQDGKSPQIDLNLRIDLTGIEHNRIGMILTDNGRGFSPSFLSKVKTVESIKHYINHKGSGKQTFSENPDASESDDEVEIDVFPALFGGAGRGLRILMARVLYGDSLVNGKREPKFIKPDLSTIDLRNDAISSGATIEIITSLTPLKMAYANKIMAKELCNHHVIDTSKEDRAMAPRSFGSLQITFPDDDTEDESIVFEDLPTAPVKPRAGSILGASSEENSSHLKTRTHIEIKKSLQEIKSNGEEENVAPNP